MKSALFSYLVLACLTGGSLGTARADLKVGDPLPDLAACKLAGKLPDSLAGKVVLLDFWASWCDSCAESFPVLDSLQQKYGPAGLVIIAVDVDDSKSDMAEFLKKHPVAFVTVQDARQYLGDQVNVSGLPTSFLTGRDGKVAFIHHGFNGADSTKAYEQEISALLKP
jgi:thiol-disulfide isomerase/thioredoxin